jgi:hypothetical protein
MIDYLAGRQNLIREAPIEELNGYLATLATEFGQDWLTRDDNNPIQVLWKRRDGLATNELLLLGQAISAMLQANGPWTRRQISGMKSTDAGTRAGAMFEVLGLNLFATPGQTIEPAKESNPGYDGRIILKDGSSLLLSLKNHGVSSNELYFRKEAGLALRDFLAPCMGVRGTESAFAPTRVLFQCLGIGSSCAKAWTQLWREALIPKIWGFGAAKHAFSASTRL